MSTYTEFEAKFLVASYLTVEETSQEMVQVRDVLKRFPLEPKPHWIRRAIQMFTDSGLSRGHMHLGAEEDQRIWLSASGVKEAERLIQDGIREHMPVSSSEAETHDSSSWTGLPPEFELTTQKKDELLSKLSLAESELELLPLGNSEKAQARALILAAKALADAPEPPVDLIWELVNRANSMAGIASLFVAILALFVQ